jgi:hypothetical protein
MGRGAVATDVTVWGSSVTETSMLDRQEGVHSTILSRGKEACMGNARLIRSMNLLLVPRQWALLGFSPSICSVVSVDMWVGHTSHSQIFAEQVACDLRGYLRRQHYCPYSYLSGHCATHKIDMCCADLSRAAWSVPLAAFAVV